jgi:hypothetical protein
MQGADFNRYIRSAWRFVSEDIALSRTVSSIVSLKVNPGFNVVALDDASSYREIYLAAVSRSYYNIMLRDYSIFQFSWAGEDAWRLAYLPNPWISGVQGAEERIREWEGLESLGELSDEDVGSLISELPYFGSIPPIRFEFAPRQYREMMHPAAHLHVGRHTENRWAISRTLNPLTFTMLMAKLYYSADWEIKSRYHNDGVDDCVDDRLIRELHASQIVHDFSATERRSLHLSSQ